MNKKLAFGFAALCATGAFVACGDGSIVSTDATDKLAKASAQTDLTELDTTDIKNLMIASGITPDAGTFGSATSTAQSSAAATNGTSSAATATSSSTGSTLGQPTGGVTGGGSSLGTTSSASTGTETAASSAAAVVSGDATKGSCKPSLPSIDRGGSTTWTYEPPEGTTIQTLTALATKQFTWTFADGTPGTSVGKGLTSEAVTYAASGTKTASVTFDYRTGSEETIECTPLEVKGAPVTGCTCTAPETVDLDGEASVAVPWTVADCVSEDPTFTYFWNGTAGEASFATSATAKGDVAPPKLVVKNSDNGMMEVTTCPSVKVLNAADPDYKFEDPAVPVEFTAADTYTLVGNLPADWHQNQGTTCSISCNVTGGNDKVSVTIDGTELSGSNYITASTITIAHTIGGYAMETVVDMPAGYSVSCSVGW